MRHRSTYSTSPRVHDVLPELTPTEEEAIYKRRIANYERAVDHNYHHGRYGTTAGWLKRVTGQYREAIHDPQELAKILALLQDTYPLPSEYEWETLD